MSTPITIVLNGDAHALDTACNVRDLLLSIDLGDAACAVEVNKTLVPKRDHAAHDLHEGDRVEVVTLVGGG
ncbi:MAG: sulfur carrier protein ThiS [Planctomycetota bacterium]|jgi:sulfur carrier protein